MGPASFRIGWANLGTDNVGPSFLCPRRFEVGNTHVGTTWAEVGPLLAHLPTWEKRWHNVGLLAGYEGVCARCVARTLYRVFQRGYFETPYTETPCTPYMVY